LSNRFLLPAQTLLDLCADQPTGARRWADTAELRSLGVSVISKAEAYACIEESPTSAVRKSFNVTLDRLLDDIVAEGGLIHSLDDRVARQWQDMINEPSLAGLPQTARLVYATALAHNLVVVEESQPGHIALQALGVQIQVL
jgi:hypothetical protein